MRGVVAGRWVYAPAGVILSDSGPGNHDSSGILDLHLSQQHIAIL